MSKKQLLAQAYVTKEQAGYEVESYAREFLRLSKRQLQKIVRTKGLLINGKVRHSKTILKEQDFVQAFLPQNEQVKLEIAAPFDLVILYEDDWFLGVEKPAGLPSYSLKGSLGLANQVAGYFVDQGSNLTPRPIHRLDTPTSGVLLFAKTALAQTDLTNAWQGGQVQRFYWGFCHGIIQEPCDLTMPLKDQEAYTKLWPVQVQQDFTELKLELITGRTHQIRQHLQAIGHPLVGDRRYGPRNSKKATRLALHASEVIFKHPYKKDELVTISSPIPSEEFDFLNL